MYYYYFVATMGVHPWWKVSKKKGGEGREEWKMQCNLPLITQKYITSGQIVQFVVGLLFACGHFYEYYKTNGDCGGMWKELGREGEGGVETRKGEEEAVDDSEWETHPPFFLSFL